MKKHLLSLLIFSSLSVHAMDTEQSHDAEYGNPGSVNHSEIELNVFETDRLLPSDQHKKKKKERTSRSKTSHCSPKKKVAAIFFAALAIQGGTQVWSGLEVSNMIQAGSPITAYPGEWVNCTTVHPTRGDDFPEDERCTAVLPDVPYRKGCTYEQNKFPDPPAFAKGECPCTRGRGCVCLVEKCEGANDFTHAVNDYITSKAIGGFSWLATALAGGFYVFFQE